MANVLDCGIVVSGFELQSRYYVHFWIYTLGKGMKLLIPAHSYELNNTTIVLLPGLLCHQITHEG